MVPLLLASAAAASAVYSEDAPASFDVAPKLRNGIVLGLALGAGVGQGSGYPNNSQEIGDPQYHAASGWMPGSGFTLLVLGALTDYLNVGFWLGSSNFRDSDDRASAFGVGLRVEAFPFAVAYPRLEGLAAFTDFGLGSARLTSAAGVTEAQGTQSYIGVGSFYEWSFGNFLGGHFGVGPSLEYDAAFSRPFEASGFLASGRFVFYGGN
jgi:hypothetical protein